MKESWPDFEEVESYFLKQTNNKKGFVIVTEICKYSDGGYSKQDIMVGKTKNGWKVIGAK